MAGPRRAARRGDPFNPNSSGIVLPVVWKILHEGVSYIEYGAARDPKPRQQRARVLIRKLRQLGYKVEITPLALATAEA